MTGVVYYRTARRVRARPTSRIRPPGAGTFAMVKLSMTVVAPPLEVVIKIEEMVSVEVIPQKPPVGLITEGEKTSPLPSVIENVVATDP